AHSSMKWVAVSACCALLSRSARSGPGGSAAACARVFFDHVANLSLKGVVCLSRCGMGPHRGLACFNDARSQLGGCWSVSAFELDMCSSLSQQRVSVLEILVDTSIGEEAVPDAA